MARHIKFSEVEPSSHPVTEATKAAATKVQEVAGASSWSWWAILGAVVMIALVWFWLRHAKARPQTWVVMIAAIAAIAVPVFMGQPMHFGPTGWSGWYGGVGLSAILFGVWLLPDLSDKIAALGAVGGGVLWCVMNIVAVSRGMMPFDCTVFACTAAVWLNILFDFEHTDEIAAKPWLVRALKLSGFAALALL